MATVRIPVLLLLGIILGVSCCKEGHRELVKGTSCLAYKECINGKQAVKTCENNQIFDTNTNSCNDVFISECSDLSKCKEGDTYRHSTSCRVFYACNSGRLVVNFCGVGRIFDPETGTCKVGSICEEEKREVSLLSLERECEEGKREPVDSCRQHRTCKNGRWRVSSCPLGKIFDKDLLKCRRGSCSQRSKRDTHGCVLGEKRRVEGSCKKYTVCEQIGLRNYTCSPCTNFNDETKQCSFVLLNPCSIINPPPVPTDPPTTTTEQPTAPTTTEEPTTPPPTEESTIPQPTAPTTTEEPTTPPPTEESTTPQPTAPTTTEESTTPQPTEESTTLQPTEGTTTEESTTAPPTEEPTTSQSSSEPDFKVAELNVVANKSESACPVGLKLPIKGMCREYLECDGGELKKKSCIWPWKFDSSRLECLFFGAKCA